MTQTETKVENHCVVRIEVGGRKTSFHGSHWREAITAYLNGIWLDNMTNSHIPKIVFNFTLLGLNGEKYIGYNSCDYDSGERIRVADKDILVVPEPTRAEVENGLIRFVKNNQIRQLAIAFPGNGNLILTKGYKRSELFIVTEGNFQSQAQHLREIVGPHIERLCEIARKF